MANDWKRVGVDLLGISDRLGERMKYMGRGYTEVYKTKGDPSQTFLPFLPLPPYSKSPYS